MMFFLKPGGVHTAGALDALGIKGKPSWLAGGFPRHPLPSQMGRPT